jgi:hypothetical protein
MTCEYASRVYDVPACIGRVISWRGRSGIISEDRGHYIGVTFDYEAAGVVHNIHPKDEDLKYFGMGSVRKPTRSQKRYADFLRSDCDCSFSEFMGFKNNRKRRKKSQQTEVEK